MSTPALFTPLTIRDLEIPNRAWLAPMCQYSAGTDGVPTAWHLVHLGARAAGGFGLVLTEATAVVPDGRISPQDVGIWNDDQVRAWRPITEFIHAQGAVAGIQLAHAGRKASVYAPGSPVSGSIGPAEGGWTTVGPSPIAFPGLADPRELSIEEIGEVVAAFAEAARRSDAAGFDVVELHAAHGYLLNNFLSPLSNHRTDSYGGDFGGRIRILVEVVDAVRAVWPADKPMFVRISGTEWLDDGWRVEDSARLATILAQHGVDLIDVSSGGNVLADIPVGPGYQVDLAREVHRVSGVATGAVGLITEPDQAEKIAADDDVTAVFLGRVALHEPSWPQRAAHELGMSDNQAPYPQQYLRGTWRH